MTTENGLTLNSKSWYARYYLHFWDKRELPPNLCPFFWKLVIAIGLSPILTPSLPWKANLSDRAVGSLFGWVAIVLVIAYIRLWFLHTAAALSATLVALGHIAIIIAAVWGWHIFDDWRQDRRIANSDKVKEPGFSTVALSAIKSWYEKHCPRIEWKG